MPAGEPALSLVALQGAAQTAPRTTNPTSEQQAEVQKRPPVRTIRDPYSAFSSVAVDPVNDEVIFTDENLFQLMVYDRKADTPATAKMTEPKRTIGGLNTKIEFNCGVYVDPKNGDIYTISHDSDGMPMTIFNRQAKGNVPPTRELDVPKGTYGIAVDEQAEELFFAIQHDSAVSVYRKYAAKDEPPIRLLQGDKTQLGDAHGIALDTKNQVMFVSNYGFSSSRNMQADREKPNWPQQRSAAIPGSGRIAAPSINVYPLKAHGDIAPLRVITGPKTQLNMPSHLFLDQERSELFLANDMGNSILVFDAAASGDVAPKRVLKGPKTLIQNPTGVFVDLKNDELWVASFGSRAATVFKRTAAGDTAPLRVIRNGPLDAPALMIGNPGAIGYDTKREEILVPN
jgi:6-phosphogluconolactonase (cycloisomerase 2 family)